MIKMKLLNGRQFLLVIAYKNKASRIDKLYTKINYIGWIQVSEWHLKFFKESIIDESIHLFLK